ncbi:MAG: TetR/AcrR family transcriptional regulator [Desulfobacterales bacterium]|nr:TetR/AcrR family transcriptional regulator [Desulfobacterales bacterium]
MKKITDSKVRSRGRPLTSPDELKEKIIIATLELLLAEGYGKVTMDRIAKEAKVAKKTIYRFVDNRDGLIELALGSWSAAFKSAFIKDAGNQEQMAELLEQGLAEIAAQVLSHKAVAMFKLLQSEFPGRIQLNEIYRENGVMRGRQILADWLQRQADKQLISKCDTLEISNLILSMVIAEPLRELALGEPHAMPMAHRIAKAVSVFLPLLTDGLTV